MTRLRGRCPKGRRLSRQGAVRHWKTQTFIAGLRSATRTRSRSSIDALMGSSASSKPMSRRNWPRPSSQATSSSATIWWPTKARRLNKSFAPKCALASSFAALQSRPQSNRDGFRQAQSAPCAPGRSAPPTPCGVPSAKSATFLSPARIVGTTSPRTLAMDSHDDPALRCCSLGLGSPGLLGNRG